MLSYLEQQAACYSSIAVEQNRKATIMTTTHPNDPIARYAVYALVALALWAGMRQLERPSGVAAERTIIIQTATPAIPTAAPALAIDLAPTPIPDALPPPELASAPPELPAPVWTDEQLSVQVDTQTAPPEVPSVDPAMQYGTPEFNQALIEAHTDLPTLNCPCGVDTTPAAPTARDYAYSKARTR